MTREEKINKIRDEMDRLDVQLENLQREKQDAALNNQKEADIIYAQIKTLRQYRTALDARIDAINEERPSSPDMETVKDAYDIIMTKMNRPLILMTENKKGIRETNSILTVCDAVKLMADKGQNPCEIAGMFMRIGQNMRKKGSFSEVYMAPNHTLYAKACRSVKELCRFINAEDADCSITLDIENSSDAVKDLMRYLSQYVRPEIDIIS